MVELLDIEWLMTTPDAPEPPDVDALLAELVNRPAWHFEAACRGVGHQAFVITGHGVQYGDRARELCEGGRVRQECLEVALADSELLGLWGGTTPTERKAMRRGRVA